MSRRQQLSNQCERRRVCLHGEERAGREGRAGITLCGEERCAAFWRNSKSFDGARLLEGVARSQLRVPKLCARKRE